LASRQGRRSHGNRNTIGPWSDAILKNLRLEFEIVL
jgi:hypothetical protein